ncbi:MAG: hypothetical protein IKJ43_00535 [Bacilli bacterium]|nr:hypothetical protein [Bacilli bacterium]
MDLIGLDSEYLYSRESIREEIKKHDEEFDMDSFYLDNLVYSYVKESGFRIITPNQKFDCFCYPYSLKHDDIIENILFSVCDDYNEVFRENDYEWRETCDDLGVIAIQLLSKYYSFVWMPSKINSFQYNELINYCNKIQSYGEKGAEIHVAMNFPGAKKVDTTEEALEYARTIVDDDMECRGEALINNGKTLKR